MASHKVTFGVLCLVALSAALPAEETRGHARNAIGGENDIMDSIYSDCLRKDSVSCVKYKLFSFVDKVLGARDQFALTEGVTVVRSPDAPQQEAARSISGDESFESLALNRISSFLNSHTIKVELKGADIVQASLFGSNDPNAPEESRGKKKKAAKILGPILALVALKAAALLPLLLGAIALIAGKALLIGKIALVLSAVIGLKKLLSQEKHVTYEVVAHPHHSSSHSTSHDLYGSGYSADAGASSASYGSSGHGGWGRSIDAQDLAYGAQKPVQA
ncbi:GM10868 [Drosophila sechellia]|uniref:GM10868 n=1 Tax=Drosophila sechellia TaxID=7238 RepID=B4I4C7_DROSE|nr:GM10868 [Drosophila sechellia]